MTRHTVEEATRLGADVLVIDTPTFVSILDLPAGSCALADADYLKRSPESIVAIARAAIGGADACLTLTEVAMSLSAEVNALLGVPDNSPEVVRRTIDKSLMRESLDETPQLRLPWLRLGCQDEFAAFLREARETYIVKPVAGVGSEGVKRYQTGDSPPSDGYPYLAEPELRGRELSVEAFSQHGQHTIIGLTSTELGTKGDATEFVAYGHIFPVALSPAEARAVEDTVRTFLDVVGVRHGLTHTEIILTADGPKVLETHTRHGGGKIRELVQAALGIDMVRLALAARLGLAPATHLTPQYHRVAAVRFLRPSPGRVRAHSGVHRARYLPHVVQLEFPWHVGDEITTEEVLGDRPAFVIVAADTQQQVEEALAAVQEELELVVQE
ncbi:ATP-grasp domain-containing protein [Micromonospora sp. NPDC049171]|uniref:ATP-grasp domain-containing protein n=1 Tax=Micromonospora sp. NPDC049171 TaxID=3155770 RepID=UPI003400ABC6